VSADLDAADLPPAAFAAAVLCELGVELVVVGGCALVLAGLEADCGDLDVVPERSSENLGRLTQALVMLGAREVRGETFRCRPIVPVDTPFGHVDVLLQRSELEYRELRQGGTDVVVEQVAVRVAPIARVLELQRLHRSGALYG
jgi:hypothetical protein